MLMESSHIKTISELEKKVTKYESKMRDLIEAYKCVVKEKETLEKTIESFSRQKKFTSNVEGNSEVDRLQGELVTLSSSIASLTEERRRMERSYLEDKRVMRAEYESNLSALRSELEAQSITNEKLKNRLKSSTVNMETTEENLIERDYQVKVLNEECARLRLELSSMQYEMSAEKNVHELRVSQLEETIADVSRNIGQMEKQHLSDSDTIAKLTERIQNILSESRVRIKSHDNQSDTPDILQFQDYDKNNPSVTSKVLVEKISRLRAQLQDIDPHVDIASIIAGDYMSHKCDTVCHTKIQELTEQLQCTELKLEAACRHKSTESSPMSYHKQELDRVNEELSLAKAKVADLQDELSSIDSLATQKERALRDSLTKQERSHKKDVSKLCQQHNETVSELQSELSKHRNRTINLLSEKDVEIESLQRIVQSRSLARVAAGEDPLDTVVLDHEYGSNNDQLDCSCPLYQCCEIKARMDQELRRLRQRKRALEVTVHQLEADNEYRRSDWSDEVAALRDRVARAESIGELGATINMEYLRNVFLRYVTSGDESCKLLMAKAIGKVLRISDSEMKDAARRCTKV